MDMVYFFKISQLVLWFWFMEMLTERMGMMIVVMVVVIMMLVYCWSIERKKERKKQKLF